MTFFLVGIIDSSVDLDSVAINGAHQKHRTEQCVKSTSI